MSEAAMRDRLVERGQRLFPAPRETIRFTGQAEADRLLNELDAQPHAFVIGCVMNRQIKAERVWLIPYAVSERLGGFSMEALSRLSRVEVKGAMSQFYERRRGGDAD
jgi:endonuclease III